MTEHMQPEGVQGGSTTGRLVNRRARRLRVYLLSLLLPFFAAVLALRHPRDPASRNVLWLFVVFYGAVFYFDPASVVDATRYAKWLAEMHQAEFGLLALMDMFFAEGSPYQDVYQPLLTFMVAGLTDQHWLLFAAFGVLFGYVYSRNIWFLIDRIPGRIGMLLGGLLLVYAFHVGIGPGLNGVRMWTAVHLFLFAFLNWNATGQRKYLLLLFLCPLVHFSFWLACVVFIAYVLSRRFGSIIYVFYLLSLFAATVDVAIVQSMMSFLPLPIEERASSYILAAQANPDAMAERRNSAVWFLQLNHWLLLSFNLLATSWMVWRGGLRQQGEARELLVLGMLLYGVINMVSYIPSLGRFYALAELMILASLILFLVRNGKQNRLDRQVMGASSALLVLNLALGIRFTLAFASLWLLMGNLFIAPFVEGSESLYDLILSLR